MSIFLVHAQTFLFIGGGGGGVPPGVPPAPSVANCVWLRHTQPSGGIGRFDCATVIGGHIWDVLNYYIATADIFSTVCSGCSD